MLKEDKNAEIAEPAKADWVTKADESVVNDLISTFAAEVT